MKRATLVIPALALSFLSGYYARTHFEGTWSDQKIGEELKLGERGLINPLLDCAQMDAHKPVRHSELREAVSDKIDQAVEQGTAEIISVYFRDLNNGPVFGLNSEILFTPASLLKVPVLINFFRRLEGNPSLLSEKIVFNPSLHVQTRVSQFIQPPAPLQPASSYSIDFLLARMITQSDNVAADMLTSYPGMNLDGTLRDMGIHLSLKDDNVWLTVGSYASLFRILYNATYLTKPFSAAALDLLTRCEFKDGLPKGVPSDIRVAHKFGERTVGSVSQFHDCGIVYHPKRPYLICLMSRGKNMGQLVGVTAEISKIVYEKVDAGQN